MPYGLIQSEIATILVSTLVFGLYYDSFFVSNQLADRYYARKDIEIVLFVLFLIVFASTY